MSNYLASRLYDQNSFYDAFLRDLRHAKSRVIIESPFITQRRMTRLMPALERLRRRNVRIIVNTKPFEEHEAKYQKQAMWAVGIMQEFGIEVLMTSGHHRKVAIIDKGILWEGSLNILSQNDSCEIMRRMQSDELVREMLSFTNLKKWTR